MSVGLWAGGATATTSCSNLCDAPHTGHHDGSGHTREPHLPRTPPGPGNQSLVSGRDPPPPSLTRTLTSSERLCNIAFAIRFSQDKVLPVQPSPRPLLRSRGCVPLRCRPPPPTQRGDPRVLRSSPRSGSLATEKTRLLQPRPGTYRFPQRSSLDLADVWIPDGEGSTSKPNVAVTSSRRTATRNPSPLVAPTFPQHQPSDAATTGPVSLQWSSTATPADGRDSARIFVTWVCQRLSSTSLDQSRLGPAHLHRDSARAIWRRVRLVASGDSPPRARE